MLILFLCRPGDLFREPLGYARAFERRGIKLAYAEDSFPPNGDLQDFLARCPEKPLLVLQPETRFPLFPRGLTEARIPTACCHYDVYAYTHRRVHWAMLFDYAFLFHPGFEDPLRSAGHPNPITLPHAVDQEFFLSSPEPERSIEVAWVGRIDGSLYGSRRRILPILATTFRMNDWKQSYSYPQLAGLYRGSKIVINIGRDDHLPDANLRVFEAMAAGALLVTSLPSELEPLGFQSGIHFAGYHNESELFDGLRHYLAHHAERERMAQAGRELVLNEHTYDRRVEPILRILERDRGTLCAPGRSWPEDRVRQVYLDYYCAHNLLGCAFGEFRRLATIRPARMLGAVPSILGALRRGLKQRVNNTVSGGRG